MTTQHWLHERVNDPYGTVNKHPFWQEVDVRQIGTHKVFERDGVWYVYDTRYNSWWHYTTEADAVEKAGGTSVDVWT